MPEAAVYEDYRAMNREDNIRLAGQISSVKSEAIAASM